MTAWDATWRIVRRKDHGLSTTARSYALYVAWHGGHIEEMPEDTAARFGLGHSILSRARQELARHGLCRYTRGGGWVRQSTTTLSIAPELLGARPTSQLVTDAWLALELDCHEAPEALVLLWLSTQGGVGWYLPARLGEAIGGCPWWRVERAVETLRARGLVEPWLAPGAGYQLRLQGVVA